MYARLNLNDNKEHADASGSGAILAGRQGEAHEVIGRSIFIKK
jgi:hypothetical protein